MLPLVSLLGYCCAGGPFCGHKHRLELLRRAASAAVQYEAASQTALLFSMLHAPCCTAPALPCGGPRQVMNRFARGSEALWFGAVQSCRSPSLLNTRRLGCSCPRRTLRTVSSSTQGRRRRVYCAAVDTSSDRGQTQAAPFAGACFRIARNSISRARSVPRTPTSCHD
jgi:hypothetical protein